MKANIYAAPVLDPLSVSDVKDHLRLETNDEDSQIAGFLKTAVGYVEDVTRRAIITQTWDYYLDRWPTGNFIELPFGNLQSVTSVKYKDTDGDETTLTVTTDYLVETNGTGIGRIVLPYGGTWPSGTLYPSNPITIRFICGWTTPATVPDRIKTAILMACADLYEMRGEPTVGAGVVENKTFERLLWPFRLWNEF